MTWCKKSTKHYGLVGNAASVTPEFSALVDKAFMCRTMSRVATNHREHNVLTEQVAAEARATRQALAEAYKDFWEKHHTLSNAQ